MKIGVCGTGTIASWASDIICQMGNENLVLYTCATSPGFECTEFAEKYGYQKISESFDALMQDPEVDVVYIAVPNHLHYNMCMKAISCNKNVICEKPFAMNAKECGEVLQAAHEKGIFISEALWTAFLPVYRELKQELESGVIGKVQSMSIVRMDNVMFLERVKHKETGGGVMLDEGPYSLCCMTTFLGTDICQVESKIRKLDTDVDAENWIDITFADGKKASIHQAMDVEENEIERYVEIQGSAGSVLMNDVENPSSVKILDPDGNLVKELVSPPQIHHRGMPPVSGYEYEWEAFEKAIREGRKECAEIPNDTTLVISEIMEKVLSE